MMQEKRKKKFNVALSVIAALLFLFIIAISFERFKMSNSEFNTNTVQNISLSINKELFDSLNNYYNVSYPNEYGICIYGIKEGNSITVLGEYDDLTLTYDENSVEIACPPLQNGLELLGTVHSHPDAKNCVLSVNDKAIDGTVMGVQCNEDNIVFYTNLDGYAHGFRVRK